MIRILTLLGMCGGSCGNIHWSSVPKPGYIWEEGEVPDDICPHCNCSDSVIRLRGRDLHRKATCQGGARNVVWEPGYRRLVIWNWRI